MYIVNTTFLVDGSIHSAWLELVKGKFLPYLQKQKEEQQPQIVFTRLLSQECQEAFTYSIQFSVSDMEGYNRYMQELFPEYLEIATPLFGEKVLYFTSLLKRVDF